VTAGCGARRLAIRTVQRRRLVAAMAMAATAGFGPLFWPFAYFDIYDYALVGTARRRARSGTTAMTTFMPACSAPMTIRGLRATCRRVVRPAPGRTGWRCYAARTAAKSPGSRST
jgi:hypothetical protein